MDTKDELPPLDLTGRTIGDYSIRKRLGQGGMGVVYQAVKNGDVGLPVALKYPTLELDRAAEDRFRREMEILSCLSSPHLVSIKDVGTHEIDGTRRPYYAMEFIQSVTLKKLLRDTKNAGIALPLSATLYILSEVLMALEYLHHIAMQDQVALEVIHRDLTPDNILIRRPQVAVMITDFGVASAITERSRDPQLVGKPRYCPPEGIEAGEQTSAMDIWSIAAVTWEMLHGKMFLGDKLTPEKGDYPLYKAILDHDLPAFGPHVPKNLADLLEHMLEREASERPSAPAARTQLLDIVAESPGLSLEQGRADLQHLVKSHYGTRSTSGKTEAFMEALPENIESLVASMTRGAPASDDDDDNDPTQRVSPPNFDIDSDSFEQEPTVIRPRLPPSVEATQVLPPPPLTKPPEKTPTTQGRGWVLYTDDPRSMAILSDTSATEQRKSVAPAPKVIGPTTPTPPQNEARAHEREETTPSEELDAPAGLHAAPTTSRDAAPEKSNFTSLRIWIAACAILFLSGLGLGYLIYG